MKLLHIRNPVALLSFAVLFSLSRVSFADTISWTTSAVSSTAFNPSSDSISLNPGSAISTPGVFTFQTGTFVVGDSEIPNQDILFTLQEDVTLNGVTQTLNISGDDNVTTVVDTLSIASGLPVSFGGEFLTLQAFSLSENEFGDFPITLEASISPAPEPGAVLLLGTAAFFAAILGIKRTRIMPLHPAETALSQER